jgi:hypothetical protein
MTPGERLWNILNAECVRLCAPWKAFAWAESPDLHRAYEAAAAKLSEVPEHPAIDREALAKALRAARWIDSPPDPWDTTPDDVRAAWLAVADEAIRLLSANTPHQERIFACPSCGPQDRCDEDGCCITHGQDLIEVADEGAAYAVKEACDQLITDHNEEMERLHMEIRGVKVECDGARFHGKGAQETLDQAHTFLDTLGAPNPESHPMTLLARLQYMDAARMAELTSAREQLAKANAANIVLAADLQHQTALYMQATDRGRELETRLDEARLIARRG